MNICQIKTFLRTVETNSFSEAAHLLYLSQSNVSKHIMSLEKEFGHKLFKRLGRQVELTEFGHYFAEKSKIIFDQYESMQNKAKHLTDVHTKTIRVATVPLLYNPVFEYIFDQFTIQNPDITLKIDEHEPINIASTIKSESYDYGVVRDFYNDISEFEYVKILDARLVALVSNDHPLASKTEISLLELKNETFISVYRESRIHAYTTDCCKSIGFSPKTEYNLRRISNVFNYVGKNKGVSLIFFQSSQDINFDEKNIVKLELKEQFLSKVILIRNKNYEVCQASKKLENYMRSAAELISESHLF